MPSHGRDGKSWQLAGRLQNHAGKQVAFTSTSRRILDVRPRTLEHARAKGRTKPQNVAAAGFPNEPITSVSGSTIDCDWNRNSTQPNKACIFRPPGVWQRLAKAGCFRAEPPDHRSGKRVIKTRRRGRWNPSQQRLFCLSQRAKLRRILGTAQWAVDKQVTGSLSLILNH